MSGDSACFKYNFALVSRVANSFQDSSSYDLVSGNRLNIENARREHEELVDALRRIGVDVIELPCDEKQPDGLFVDDIAVVINGTALICNPPTIRDRPSRQGELAVVRQVLRKEIGLKIVEVDTEKANVEGSDVLWTGREIFVGLSNRTNMLGAQAVGKAFPEYPTTIVKVYPPAVHLKDYIGMAGPEVMTIGKSEGAQKTFQEIRNSGAVGYKYITVDEDEAANVIYANNVLLHLANEQIPKGSARILAFSHQELLIKCKNSLKLQTHKIYTNKIDYPRVAIHMVEPLKRGGRLSNCVLLVNRVRHPKRIPTTAQ